MMIDKYDLINNICDDIKETLRKKNHDYGDSVSQTRKKFPCATCIRLTDKINRLQNLYLRGQNKMLVEDETLKDTLLDIAGYAVLELVEIMNDEQEQKAEEANKNNVIKNNPLCDYV